MTMKKMTMGVGLALGLAAAALIGCSSETGESDTQAVSQPATAAPAALFRVNRPARADAEVADRLAALASAFGQRVTGSSLRVSRSNIDVPGEAHHARVDAELSTVANMFGRYETRDDSIEVYDNTPNKMAPSASDLSKDAATKVFAAALDRLTSAGLVDASRVQSAGAVVREIHASEGNNTGVQKHWVDEYAFFAPLSLNGIHVGTFSDEYGVWINVHRSGKVRRIQISGLAIAAAESGAVTPAGSVASVARAASGVAAAARSKLGTSDVEDIGQRYVVNENAAGPEVLTPRRLSRVVPMGSGPAGETIRGKAYVASYAVNDGSGDVLISPAPGRLGPLPSDKK
jgi:hypothetical protein